MIDYSTSIVKVNFKSIYNSSFGKTLFMCLEILNKVDIFYQMFSEEQIKSELNEYFKDSKHFLKEKTEVEIVQDFLQVLAPFMKVIPKFLKFNTVYEFKEEELVVNIKNLSFFINNIWPILVTNIIYKNINIYDYSDKSKTIACLDISDEEIIKFYPNYVSIEDAVEMFLIDLQNWLYFNCFSIKEIKTRKEGIKDIITITI